MKMFGDSSFDDDRCFSMFSNCSGDCGICGCGGFCLAGHGDDDFCLATAEQIIDRLDNNLYPDSRELMIETLALTYKIGYKKEGK